MTAPTARTNRTATHLRGIFLTATAVPGNTTEHLGNDHETAGTMWRQHAAIPLTWNQVSNGLEAQGHDFLCTCLGTLSTR
jgi:hypothetical protein